MARKTTSRESFYRKQKEESWKQRNKRLSEESERRKKGKKRVMLKDPKYPNCWTEKWVEESEID